MMGESSPDTYTEGTLLCHDAEPFDGAHLSMFPWPAFGNVVQDWLDFDFPDTLDNADQSPHMGYGTRSDVPHPLPSLRAHENAYRGDATLPPPSPCAKIVPQDAATHQWPFSHVRESGPSKYRLPPIRAALEDRPYKQGSPRNVVDRLCDLLYKDNLPDLTVVPDDPAVVPAISLLRNAIDSYFSKFHDILPVIHVPTWDLAKAPGVLLAAMACIGAMHLHDPQSNDNANSLSDTCSQIIMWLGASSSSVYDDVHYLTACCLHQIFSLGSGNRALYQNADRGRGMLVGSLRGLGALSSRLSIEQDSCRNRDSELRTAQGSGTVQDDWYRWRDSEREIRLAWSSFEYDCTLCTLTNRRGAVDLSELPATLPSAETLWQAPSAQAWKALQQQSPHAEGAVLSGLLRSLLAGEMLPSYVSSWGKRLCSQIVGRLLWDLKQMEAIWVSDYLGVTDLSTAQKQMKKTLLVAFGNLATTMRLANSNSELIDYNIARLIYHYSHLYSAEDILDLVVFLLRGIATTKVDNHAGNRSNRHQIELAKQRLVSKLRSQPRRTRKLVWHAAQITAIADCYPVSAPCEILRVFMGYSFLLAFSRYCIDFHTAQGDIRTTKAQLDILNPTDRQKEDIALWVEHGGPASLAAIENICSVRCVTALSQQAQSLMIKLRGWGLADKFAKILNIFELSDG
jgi:hypothetical protein